MLIKFLKHGTGSVRKAVNYVVSTHDAKGDVRAGVYVLDGDREWLSLVGDSLEIKHKYTSAVISWTSQDQPTREQILESLDEFYKTAFAGLREERCCKLAVLHEEPDGGHHVHVLMLRTDLETGLAYNPAPPGHEKDFNHVRDYLNYKYNWADPQDPQRKQHFKVSKVEHYNQLSRLAVPDPSDQKRTERKDQAAFKESLIELVNQEFIDGNIQTHSDVKQLISEFGSVRVVNARKERPSYMCISVPCFQKEIRLKGSLFEENLNEESVRELKDAITQEIEREQSGLSAKTYRGAREVPRFATTTVAELAECLRKSRDRRAAENIEYYARCPSTNAGAQLKPSSFVEQPERTNAAFVRDNDQIESDIATDTAKCTKREALDGSQTSSRNSTAESAGNPGIKTASQNSPKDGRNELVHNSGTICHPYYLDMENLIHGRTEYFVRKQKSAQSVEDRTRTAVSDIHAESRSRIQFENSGFTAGSGFIAKISSDRTATFRRIIQFVNEFSQTIIEAAGRNRNQADPDRRKHHEFRVKSGYEETGLHHSVEAGSRKDRFEHHWAVPRSFNQWIRDCGGRREENESGFSRAEKDVERSESKLTSLSRTIEQYVVRSRTLRKVSESKLNANEYSVSQSDDNSPGW